MRHPRRRWTAECARIWSDPRLAYRWRDASRVIAEGAYGGCADYALVYGALARALDIPVVWVKTMDASWIRAFVTGPEPEVWSGHVFLELHDRDRWVLLDPVENVLYEDYDPRSRILPGDRWKDQTRATFTGFDLSQLPVPPGRAAGSRLAFVAGDNPGFDLAAERITELGGTIGSSGNADFEHWMPGVPGHTLVVLSLAGNDVLPEPLRSRYAGARFAALARHHAGERWWIERRVADQDTEVILVYGVDPRALEQAISSMTL